MQKTTKKWLGLQFDSSDVKVPTKQPPRPCKKKLVKPQTINFHKKLAPKTVEDLAVHSKKILEVESWLRGNVLAPSNSHLGRFLLVRGPTGSGKSTTVSVLCQHLKINITEWINPIDQDFEICRGPNQVNRFIEFLTEAKYQSLFADCGKKIILVEEIPNALVQNPDQFNSVLEECYYNGNNVIIFIFTETNDRNKLIDSLFPDELKLNYKIHEISFNPCAATLIKQALRRGHDLVQKNLDSFKSPNSDTVSAIIATANGDLKSAMNQYFFATVLGASELPTVAEKKSPKNLKRKRNDSSKSVKVMSRDESLGLFHGIGRVMNPKRAENTGRIQCDFEKLIDEFSAQPQTFSNFLFENYLKYFGDIYDVCSGIEMLSQGQVFLERWVDRGDVLVFALWVSTLGLMVYNRHRVSKWTPITGPKRAKTKNYEENKIPVTELFYYNIINKFENKAFVS